MTGHFLALSRGFLYGLHNGSSSAASLGHYARVEIGFDTNVLRLLRALDAAGSHSTVPRSPGSAGKGDLNLPAASRLEVAACGVRQRVRRLATHAEEEHPSDRINANTMGSLCKAPAHQGQRLLLAHAPWHHAERTRGSFRGRSRDRELPPRLFRKAPLDLLLVLFTQ